MAPRTLFEKFGHDCEIPVVDSERTNRQSKFYYWFNRLRVINETNQRSYSFFRSIKKIQHEHVKLQQHPWMIHPFSNFKKYWEMFVSCVLMLQFIMIPLDVAFFNFDVEDNFVRTKTFISIRIINDALSFFDVFLEFLCGYCDHENGVVVVSPLQTAKRYLSRRFILDVISSIPTDVILNKYNLNDTWSNRKLFFILHYLGLIKLFRYYTLVNYTFSMIGYEITEVYYVIHRLAIALLSLALYIHVITCCIISWMELEVPFSVAINDRADIVSMYGPNIQSLANIYLNCLNSCIRLVLCSGYGFNGKENASRLFHINVWIVSRILHLIAIAYVTQLYRIIYSPYFKYTVLRSEVQDYMRHRRIPIFLQNRILTFYEIKFRDGFFEEQEILKTVSKQLQQEIAMTTRRKLIEGVSFFDKLPYALLVRVASSLTYEFYLTNDVIIKSGTIGDSMYFIVYGTVAVFSPSGKELVHLQDGDHFGEVALVTNAGIRIATVIATEVCEVYRLDRKDFNKAVLPYPDVYARVAEGANRRKMDTAKADHILPKELIIDKSEEVLLSTSSEPLKQVSFRTRSPEISGIRSKSRND